MSARDAMRQFKREVRSLEGFEHWILRFAAKQADTMGTTPLHALSCHKRPPCGVRSPNAQTPRRSGQPRSMARNRPLILRQGERTRISNSILQDRIGSQRALAASLCFMPIGVSARRDHVGFSRFLSRAFTVPTFVLATRSLIRDFRHACQGIRVDGTISEMGFLYLAVATTDTGLAYAFLEKLVQPQLGRMHGKSSSRRGQPRLSRQTGARA